MAADEVKGGRMAWSRGLGSGFDWIAPSPSPEQVAMMEDVFPDIIQIPAAALLESTGNWEEKAILARSFSRWVPPDAFIREFRRAGVPGDIDTVSLAHRCHIFRFGDALAREMVLGRPWVINGQPIATEGWRPEFIPAADSVASILLWVRLPNLPLEFWEDDILRLILLPAGHFLFSDSATHLKTRGGFARACVRVDLRCPLRPGTRVCGMNSPFWQSFQYEHLLGICPECGTLHLAGPCAAPPPATGTSSSECRGPFGPWMSAFRQRRPPVTQPLGRQQSKAQTAPASASASHPVQASPEGKVAVKLARRRARKTGMARGIAGEVPGLSLGGEKENSGDSAGCSGMPVKPVFSAVPVSVTNSTERAGCSEPVKPGFPSETLNSVRSQISTSNPFAALGRDSVVEGTLVMRDANPVSSKRPRSVESSPLRTASISEKRKGKGLYKAPKNSKGKLPSSESLIPARGLDVISEGELNQAAKTGGSAHEDAVSRLQLAIQGNASDSMLVAENSSRSAEKAMVTGAPSEALHLMECSNHMMEEQSGSHPPPICK